MKIGILSILKFFLGLLLLPAVVNVTIAFYNQLQSLERLHVIFFYGIIAYVIMHLFIFTPIGFFQFWQKIFADLFKFSTIMASIIPMIIPLITTLILLLLYLLKPALKVHEIDRYVVFAVGFFFAMHVILIAHQLYGEDNNVIKPNYLFSFSLVYILNIILVAALLGLNFEKFSFLNFLRALGELLEKTYLALYHKFLILKKT